MNSYKDPSIFDTHNAKCLTSEEVARTFIPSKFFEHLIKNNNNIIIGPRGSGKTTLLKMLQLEALCEWRHEELGFYCDSIKYVGAFIPADIAWFSQWGVIDDLHVTLNQKDKLKNTLFSIHALRSMIDAFIYCTTESIKGHPYLSKYYVDLNKKSEGILIDGIGDLLDFKVSIESLRYMKMYLRKRVAKIGVCIEKCKNNKYEIEKSDYDFIYNDFYVILSSVVDLMNEAAKNNSLRWALLFDELELAPREIRENTIKYLRVHTDQRLLFKLSVSPYSKEFDAFQDIVGPSPSNDFVPIYLLYYYKDEMRRFCRSMFDQMCDMIGIDNVKPVHVFGTSLLDLGNTIKEPSFIGRESGQNMSSYRVETELYRRFKRLSEIDESFRSYLKKKEIDIKNISKMSEQQRANKIRRITNVVCIRDLFLNANMTINTKNSGQLYTGATSLFDMTEGNPRMFIGIMSPLLSEYMKVKGTIRVSMQKDMVEKTSKRFMALLETIPVEKSPFLNIHGLKELLDVIGVYFFNRMVRAQFASDPPLTFRVDKKIPQKIRDVLGRAFNVGAVVYMPEDNSELFIDEVSEKRFRLSYLLSPVYHLPMVAGKTINLSTILGIDNNPDTISLFE